ncbi:MAG: 2-oxoglutarate dehydrogenase complex dihydrolipoyllysine-residue succinyltransferase [Flavobacteriales bacterium]
MANVDIKVPSPGESITEVRIAQWLVKDGDVVNKDQVIAEIDSDKATLELSAESAGQVKILAEADQTVNVGDVVAKIDTSVAAPAKSTTKAAPTPPAEKAPAKEQPVKAPAAATAASATPVAKAMLDEKGLSADKVKGTGPNGRVTKSDVSAYVSGGVKTDAIAMFRTAAEGWGGSREQKRSKMTSLRQTVGKRLVMAKNQTAMLTTFNEVDMSAVMALRDKYKDKFKETHGVNLGFMSFFTKAVTEALRLFPAVNGQIDGEEIILSDYADIGIAVSSPKGLMVPVLRNAERMSLAEIEAGIKALAVKARDGKLTIDEMTGGTFTITNGGVFGSMLSTPIINPPQSAILGMHNIVERPVAVNGQVVIRPVMYVALSYDHRIIDGKESVSFLYKVKEMIEDPNKLIFGAKDPGEVLLGL